MENSNDILTQMLEVAEQDKKMSEKQKKIVAAAIELFAERGFAATSTSEIAKRAGVAEGTIFRHYKTKKDLLTSITMPIMIESVAPFLARNFVAEVFEQEYPDFRTFLMALVRNRFEFARENSSVVKIYMQELLYHDEMREQFSKIFMVHVKGQFDRIINFYKERGEINDMPNSTIMRALITNIIGFLITRFMIMPQANWEDDAEIERTVTCILNGIS
ncbi:TetR/AcrR family transcriptional regulator [Listeria booriae]|uniref:TetR/AcrR family transcriptional regulator n=1 Tax=Listeria booriae TaxID=1552123 RepID=UPI0016292D5B|nr:TetR/AcrR family transcriptional regulator [Listeria booriae]MBC2057396.1 TetR/AcrR family transcriptional regulator [Listeria booriae]